MKYFKSITGDVYGYDADQQHLIDIAVAAGWKDITGNWPPPPTAADIAAQERVQCKAIAKQRLLDTDYTQLSDISPALLNKAEFDKYRSTVRNLYLNPVEDPIWPAEPTPIWKTN